MEFKGEVDLCYPLYPLYPWKVVSALSAPSISDSTASPSFVTLPARMSSRCLVTGAAGFIGSHVCRSLLERGHEVTGFDDLSGGFLDNVPEGVEFVRGSILDSKQVAELFTYRKIDYVFHLAAYAAEGLSHFIKRFSYSNNILGSVNLVNAAVNAGTVRCFVFASSIAVYGRNQLPMSEDLTPMPEDPYGIAKYAVELDLREAREMFGLRSIVFRLHNVYGECQNLGDPYRNVIGIFMSRLMQGKPLTIFGDGKQTRAFTHVSDVAPVIADSIHRPHAYNEVFNLGADHPTTVLELASAVGCAMNAKPEIQFLPARTEVVHAYADHEKARACFGDLIKQLPLEDGLARMAAWAKKWGVRQGQVFNEIEVWKNMPSSWREMLGK